MNEHEIEAELLHEFHRHGAVPSYEPIVGGGKNGCVLHYRANNAVLNDGDLLLIDAGAEYDCYASDITRTFPVNGRFSTEQRALYDIVLKAQNAAIDEVRPGRPFERVSRRGRAERSRAGLIKNRPAQRQRSKRTSASRPIVRSTCTRPDTGSASTCTMSAITASTANSANSSPAWSSPSSPASISRLT